MNSFIVSLIRPYISQYLLKLAAERAAQYLQDRREQRVAGEAADVDDPDSLSSMSDTFPEDDYDSTDLGSSKSGILLMLLSGVIVGATVAIAVIRLLQHDTNS
ncbi:MAG: hypothetical protein AAF485_18960 [Chloroflexota bacterium]